MSFSGPGAPPGQQESLRRQIPADLARLLLALVAAAILTALGFAGLVVSTAPRWFSLLVQPFCLLLLPGYLVESLDRNSYSFSGGSVLWVSGTFYFCVALLILFPRGKPVQS